MAKYGYMAKIGADTSGLQSALKDINSSLAATDREINATNKAMAALLSESILLFAVI